MKRSSIYDELSPATEDVFYSRVINLLPGTRAEGLRCEIENIAIRFGRCETEYEALSYYWGEILNPTQVSLLVLVLAYPYTGH